MSNSNERTLKLEWVLNSLPWSIAKYYAEMYDIPVEMINGAFETRQYHDNVSDLDDEK